MAHFGQGNAARGADRDRWHSDEYGANTRGHNSRQFGDDTPRGSRDFRGNDRDYRGDFHGAQESRSRQYDSRPRSRSRSRSPPRRFEGGDVSGSDHWRREQGGQRRSAKYDPQPSASLILRGLTPHVSDAMIQRALEAFHPTSVRVMVHKITGEPRGFAFANFASINAASAVMNAFASQPLVVDNQPVAISFADVNRPSPNAPHNNGDAGPSRLDWICDQCDASNFSRRTECFKCHATKSPFAMEMPAKPSGNSRQHQFQQHASPYGSNDRNHGTNFQQRPPFVDGPGRREDPPNEAEESPSHVLAVRMIPFEVEEGELQVFFAQFHGVCDIRLIRDRETNQSRGFAFVEFTDIEAAQRMKDNSDALFLRGDQLRVGFARETFRPRPSHASERFEPAPLHPIAAAALEQAQWALGNNYHSRQQAQQQQEMPPTGDVGLDDLDALLGSAAAAARPHIDQPKKPWPLPFEKAGGMYTFMSQYGLYYDTDSMFYFDPQSKLYYNSFMGVYYRFQDGANPQFKVFTPPVPTDEAQFATSQVPQQQVNPQAASERKPIALSLMKKDKKKPLIAFSIKTPSGSLSAKTVSAFDAPVAMTEPSVTGVGVLGTGVPTVTAASAAVRKKSAQDIAKWSQRQQRGNQAPGADAAPHDDQRTTQQAVAQSVVVDVPLEAPICLLCRRKFGSMDQLRKHETLSKLHAENLAKAKQDKEIVAAQIRERDHEEHERQQPSTGSLKRPRNEEEETVGASSKEAAAESLESGIGAKMLKMMGWKQGEGLGKHGTGITVPVEAVGNVASETTGLGAKTTPSIDLSEVASYKERLQKMARARYDATESKTVNDLYI